MILPNEIIFYLLSFFTLEDIFKFSLISEEQYDLSKEYFNIIVNKVRKKYNETYIASYSDIELLKRIYYLNNSLLRNKK